MIIILFLILILIYFIPRYPDPQVLKGFLSNEEREYIINKAEKNLKPSMISSDFKLDEKVRKSETAWLEKDDPVVNSVIQRCLEFTDRPFVNCEKLQVLRYEPGGFYKPHQDAFKNEKNMRMYTFILALNDDYEGGETAFPNLGKTYKLEKGDALFFDTLDNYEMITSKALHGGRPVKSGEKWICNLWVHKYPYS
jgi:predicted 2-oxoglutarate/Fe(II)-dependent dioxygenase YbiX